MFLWDLDDLDDADKLHIARLNDSSFDSKSDAEKESILSRIDQWPLLFPVHETRFRSLHEQLTSLVKLKPKLQKLATSQGPEKVHQTQFWIQFWTSSLFRHTCKSSNWTGALLRACNALLSNACLPLTSSKATDRPCHKWWASSSNSSTRRSNQQLTKLTLRRRIGQIPWISYFARFCLNTRLAQNGVRIKGNLKLHCKINMSIYSKLKSNANFNTKFLYTYYNLNLKFKL